MQNDISEMLQGAVAKLSEDIARAEEAFVIKAIMLAGYEPIASEDAEWRKHLEMRHEGVGRKVIYVGGQPKWAIVTESPQSSWDKTAPVDYRYTVRMEEVPYTVAHQI